MSSSNRPDDGHAKRIISDSAQTAYERWELPNMDQPPEPEEIEIEDLPALPTAEEIEAIRQAAHNEGLEAGRLEGLAAGQAEIDARVAQLQQVLDELVEPLQLVDEKVEEELVELVIVMARQVIRRQLAIEPGEIVGLVRESLGALPAAARRVELALHPEDAELVRQSLDMGHEDERRWHIVEDPLLSRGGCRVSSEHSRIDASVEKRLNAVISQLLGGERNEDREEAGDVSDA